MYHLMDSSCNLVDLVYYRPQRSWGKVMFLQASAILLTGGGGVSASVHAGIPHPPPLREQTPPGADTPGSRHPPGADTPWEQTPPWSRHSPRSRHPRSRHPPGSRHTPPGADTPWEQIPPEQTPPTPLGADNPQEQTPP